LYTIEEIATHWDIKEHVAVGGQIFFASAFAAFVTNSVVRATQDNNDITFSSIIIFDEGETALNAGAVWQYNDIPGFLLVALVCGYVGGYHTRACNWVRKKRTGISPMWQVINTALTAIIVCVVFSCMPLMFLNCQYDDSDSHRRLAGAGARRYVQYTCKDHYYSELASLSLAGEEGVIRHLLSRDAVEFEISPLAIFFVFYVPLTVISMGLCLPAGTFVPNLLLGALNGRIIGEIAQLVFKNSTISLPGVYGMIGAAAQLGSWTRTMIAVVTVMVEITGDVGLIVPLIVCVIMARGIATSIAHHSYSHSGFYDLVEAMDTGGPIMLHPNDWVPPDINSKSSKFVKHRSSLSETKVPGDGESTVGALSPRSSMGDMTDGSNIPGP
jgi:H+/Cl- antiporter ClcA